MPATMLTAFASKASSGWCPKTTAMYFGLLGCCRCSLLSLVTAVARKLHPLRSLSSTSLGTVLWPDLLWLVGRLATTGGFFYLRRPVEGLSAASRHLTWRLSAALGDSAYGRTYFSSPLGVDTLWLRHAVRPHLLLLVAVRWWPVLLGDLLAVAGLVGAAAPALDLLLGRFGWPLLGNLSAVTGLGCGAIALELGPLLAYQASGWMLLFAQDLFLVLWQALPRWVLQVRHLRLTKTRRRWLSRILHATKAGASVATGCLSVTFLVTAVATCLLCTTRLLLVVLTAILPAVWAAFSTVLSTLSPILLCFLRTPEVSHQVSRARRPVPPSSVWIRPFAADTGLLLRATTFG